MASLHEKQNKITEIEQYVDFLSNVPDDAANITRNEPVPKSIYEQKKKMIGFEYFILSADSSYFVSRFLFFNGLVEYSFFSGQQCIENYLKAYLKFSNKYPKEDLHDLSELLELCRNAGKDDFINSARANIIIERFNPFYEIARYQVQRNFRPKGGKYMFLFPDDIYPLDYFVFKMRELLPYPKNMWNVLKEGRPLEILNDVAASFFKENNINFM